LSFIIGPHRTVSKSRSCSKSAVLPYVLKPVNISKGEQFNPDFLKIAPNNRMPAIVDPQGPGGRPISCL
jgi:glutathione S-transferase